MKSLWNRIMRQRGSLHAGRYAAVAPLPEGLDTLWLERIAQMHPGFGVNAKAVPHVAEALLTYFDCLSRTDKPCALPSLAAQVFWDAWAALDRAGLDRLRAHHFPSSADESSPRTHAEWEQAIANCLVQARVIAGQSAAAPVLPALFVLDQQLALPGGHGWLISAGRVGHVKLDAHGIMSGIPVFPEVMAPAGMLMAGLVSAAAFNDFLAAPPAASGLIGNGNGGDGGVDGAASMGGDACGGDGGGDGGE